MVCKANSYLQWGAKLIKKIGKLVIDTHWDESNWSAIIIIHRKVEEIIECMNQEKKDINLQITCKCGLKHFIYMGADGTLQWEDVEND